jgi:hypothetical protein
MIPAIPDTDGNEFDPTAHRLSYDQFEYRCLIEIADARVEGRPVSFKVSSAVFHEDGVSRD